MEESSSSTTPSSAPASSARVTRSRSPCAAATRLTVGRASAAISSRTSRVWPGSRARRPPSRSCKVSGIGRARPGTGRVSVRTSSRPSSSAKKGLPAVASCTRASSGRVRSSPSRSSSSRCTAARLNGPTEIRSSRSVRERALELERLRELRGLSQGREETDRLVVQASKRDLDRTRRRRVEPLDVVEGDKDRLLLGQGTQDVQHRKPDCMRIGRRLAGLHEQQRHLQRPPPRRRERGPDLVEHVAEQLREPGERE